MGFSDNSPNKSVCLTPEKKDPGKGFKKVKDLLQNSPGNDSSVSRFVDRKNEEEEAAAGESCFDLKLMPAAESEFSTPTGILNKQAPSLVCPPAPRKPKSVLMPEKGVSCRKRVFLDMINDVNSLFPEAVQADFGKKMKKVRN